jgi:predicted dehydrogenase
VIVGWTPSDKARAFRSLLLGVNKGGKLRYVRQADGEIEQTDESHPGGDALGEQAAAFAAAVQGRRRVELDGREGRRALELALTVGSLVRERLRKFE